jgi:hypothetical protein
MKTRRLIWLCGSTVALLGMGLASAARAQGTGRSLDIDPSVRAAGMGLASDAVFWDAGTNHWGNPALLGNQRGIAYEWGSTQLVPGLPADIDFTTNVLKLGGAGLGLAFSGKPLGLGGLHLDYGQSEGTDDQGNPSGTFDTYEQIDAWSFGVSLARAGETIARLTGHDPEDVSRYGDVAFGMTGKKLEMNLGPTESGGTNAHDLGVMVRFSPTQFIPNVRDVFGLDFSYGRSNLSDGNPTVSLPSESTAVEVSEHQRRGLAVRGTLDWPTMSASMGGPAWLWKGLHPLLSVAHADDHSRISASISTDETDGDGWEVTLANVYSWRTGHYHDVLGQIDGDTRGWSVGLPIAGLGGVRYDFARLPAAQDTGLPDLERHAVTAWIDALEVWRLAHGETPAASSR